MTTTQIITAILIILATVLIGGGIFAYQYAKRHMSAPKVVSGQIGMGHRRFSKKLHYVFVYKENGKEISAIIPEKDGIRHAGKPRVKAVVRQGSLPWFGTMPIYRVNVLAK